MKPVLQYSVVCDDVATTVDNKLVLIGAFDTLHARSFPAVHPRLFVVNHWTGGEGSFRERLQLVSPSGEVLVQGPETDFALTSAGDAHTVTARLESLRFAAPGLYRFRVLLDGGTVVEYPLRVWPLSSPGPAEVQ